MHNRPSLSTDAARPTHPNIPTVTVAAVRRPPSPTLPSLGAVPPLSAPGTPPVVLSQRFHTPTRDDDARGWLWVVAAVCGLVLALALSTSVFVVARNGAAARQAQAEDAAALAGLPTPQSAQAPGSRAPGALPATLLMPDGQEITLTPWDGEGRFTVLVMGMDRRPNERGLAFRTDSMMLVSLDPQAQSLSVLSIPRDLFVAVPGYPQLQRINTALLLGELQGGSMTGPTLAMQTAQYNFGIRVHDYLVVDFNAFITLVDAVGGITVNNPTNISDGLYPDMNYGYAPFNLRAGTHTLDGETALKFARTRHGDSDFRRAERQQEVVRGLRTRLADPLSLARLVQQAPALWTSLEQDVSTGLTFSQVMQLTLWLAEVPSENIRYGVIDERYVTSYLTPEGAAVLVPDRAALGTLMAEVFGPDYGR